MTVIDNKAEPRIEERLIALTRDLILIPSIPTRPDDRRHCYEFVKNHLESLETIEVREFEHNGIPSMIAAPPGCHKPDILLCGHLDVITHPDVSSYRSRICDGRIYGPGAGDMKGALAVLLEVFRSMHTNSPDASLGIAITCDEECGGESGIGYLFGPEGLRCGLAMIPDGGSLNEITIEEKGIIHLRVGCGGHAAHAAQPWLGKNPVEHLMEGLDKLLGYFHGLKKKEDHWYPTCAVTIIGTENQTINRIPSDAYAILDVRFPPPFTVDEILKNIKKVLGDDIHTNVVISAEPTSFSRDPLYKKITEKITGKPAIYVRDDGGSDARFIGPCGIPVLISRPVVGNLHARDEWIDISSMILFYRIYEQYLLKKL